MYLRYAGRSVRTCPFLEGVGNAQQQLLLAQGSNASATAYRQATWLVQANDGMPRKCTHLMTVSGPVQSSNRMA
jgi:hypothetical protein